MALARCIVAKRIGIIVCGVHHCTPSSSCCADGACTRGAECSRHDFSFKESNGSRACATRRRRHRALSAPRTGLRWLLLSLCRFAARLTTAFGAAATTVDARAYDLYMRLGVCERVMCVHTIVRTHPSEEKGLGFVMKNDLISVRACCTHRFVQEKNRRHF